eukprot:m.161096 g.161096  ORF g.161096 m.161096 type:complete len:201 (+) comp14569_c0_seq4:3409-4011(+)
MTLDLAGHDHPHLNGNEEDRFRVRLPRHIDRIEGHGHDLDLGEVTLSRNDPGERQPARYHRTQDGNLDRGHGHVGKIDTPVDPATPARRLRDDDLDHRLRDDLDHHLRDDHDRHSADIGHRAVLERGLVLLHLRLVAILGPDQQHRTVPQDDTRHGPTTRSDGRIYISVYFDICKVLYATAQDRSRWFESCMAHVVLPIA